MLIQTGFSLCFQLPKSFDKSLDKANSEFMKKRSEKVVKYFMNDILFFI
jgi:hypothetical protein